LTLKTTSTRKFETDRKTKEVSESYETIIEPKYEFKDIGVALEGKFSTQNVQQVTVSKTDVVKGLKLSLGMTQDLSRDRAFQQTVNAGVEYRHPQFFLKSNVGVPFESRPIPVTGNIVFQPLDNIYLGAKYDFKYSTGEKGRLDREVEFKVAGASGATKGYITTTLDKKLGFFAVHQLDNEQVGVRVTAELPREDAVNTKVGVDLVAAYRYNLSTSLNGKLGITPALGDEKRKTGIRLGLGTTYALKDNCTATLAADLNVGQFLGNGGNPHSLGFELKLK
jgi:hypothetical protein